MNLHAIGITARTGRAVAVLCASVVVTACAGLAPTKVADGVLTDPNGKTLYTFDRDVAAPGKSACNGPCATLWPAFTASTAPLGSTDYTVIARDDGGRQWALRGKPLYTFSKDAKPGDRTGDGFNNVWHVARP